MNSQQEEEAFSEDEQEEEVSGPGRIIMPNEEILGIDDAGTVVTEEPAPPAEKVEVSDYAVEQGLLVRAHEFLSTATVGEPDKLAKWRNDYRRHFGT